MRPHLTSSLVTVWRIIQMMISQRWPSMLQRLRRQASQIRQGSSTSGMCILARTCYNLLFPFPLILPPDLTGSYRHLITLSPHYLATSSPCHLVTQSPSHLTTSLPCHLVTLTPSSSPRPRPCPDLDLDLVLTLPSSSPRPRPHLALALVLSLSSPGPRLVLVYSSSRLLIPYTPEYSLS